MTHHFRSWHLCAAHLRNWRCLWDVAKMRGMDAQSLATSLRFGFARRAQDQRQRSVGFVSVNAEMLAKNMSQTRRSEHSFNDDRALAAHPSAHCALRDSEHASGRLLRGVRLAQALNQCSRDYLPRNRHTGRSPSIGVRHFCATFRSHVVIRQPRFANQRLQATEAHPTKLGRSGSLGRLSVSGCCRRLARSRPGPGATSASAKSRCAQRVAFERLDSREMPLSGPAKRASACGARKVAHGH